MSGFAWLCRAAIVVAIAGLFGTWRSSGSVSLNGFQGPHNGWLVVVFGLIALVGVGGAARGSWTAIVLVFGCGAAMTYAAVLSLVDDGSVLGGSSGWGVWLTLLASIGLVLAAVVAVARRLRPGPAL